MQGNFAGGRFSPVCLFFGAFGKFRKATISFVVSVRPSVRMEQLGCRWTDFHEFWYLKILRNSVEKIQVWLKSDKNNSEDLCTYLISCLVLLRMRNISGKSCRENQNAHFMFSNPFFPENRDIYEIMYKNMAVPYRPQMNYNLRRLSRFACWITKARIQTHTRTI